MNSSNPALSDSVFQNIDSYGDSSVMTVSGTATKTMIALVLTLCTAGWMWISFQQAAGLNPGPEQMARAISQLFPYGVGGFIVGLIASFATMFKPNWAPITTPVYALAEGLFLGGISALVQTQFPDVPIAFQALALTFGAAGIMLVCYQTGLIKVTEKLRSGIIIATGAICMIYLATLVLGLFKVEVPYIHGAGPIGIAFSVFVVGLATFNLLLDFDLIEGMAQQRAPKHMEWYGAFALLMTLVWMYIEILRLLSKLNSRD